MAMFFYQKLHIYQTRSRMIIVGVSKADQRCRILKLARQDGQVLEGVEDNTSYTQQECNALLRKVNEGNMHHGGLQFVCKAHGIIGCFRLTDTYYIWVVTKKELVGHVCGGHKVYRVEEAQLLPLACTYKSDNPSSLSVVERRYRKLLAGLDLTKNFFFSYTYNLAATLQRNLHDPDIGNMLFDNMFVWNSYLTRELRDTVQHDRWTIPLIHGFWEQRCVSVFGRTIFLTLLARRSCHFAGTRYRKRGINDMGKVANEVETEQMIDAGYDYKTGLPIWTSHVQLRGSIPLYWSQQPGPLNAKPDIILQHFDPMYRVTHSHFQDLRQRYGNPIVVLNLLRSKERKKPRETLLRKELATAVSMLNDKEAPNDRLVYIPWDFQKYAKQQGANVLLEISTLTNLSLEMTGLYVHGLPPPDGKPLPGPPLDGPRPPPVIKLPNGKVQAGGVWSQFQRGVLRTNCIDCLDRTNVAQFAFGLMAFGRQLYEIGVAERPDMDSESSMAFQLMEMYEAMGNTLALQYGGSEAHNVFFQRKKGEWEAAAQSKDLMTSLRRFYNNTYTDAEKQDAINLFLGNFIPQPGKVHIWELESDVYLHWCHTPVNGTRRAGPSISAPRLSGQKSLSAPNNFTASTIHSPPLSPVASLTSSSLTQIIALAPGQLGTNQAALPLQETTSGVQAPLQAPQHRGENGTVRGAFGLRNSGRGAVLGMSSSDMNGPSGSISSTTGTTETGWDLRVVLNQLLGKDNVAPVRTHDMGSGTRYRLTNFDEILSKQPRMMHVQLYEGRRSTAVLWQRLQNAFAFFWTLPPDGQGQEGVRRPPSQSLTSSYLSQPQSPSASSLPSLSLFVPTSLRSSSLKSTNITPPISPLAPLPVSPKPPPPEARSATSASTTSLIPALSSSSFQTRKSAPAFQVPSPTKVLSDIRSHLMPSAKINIAGTQINSINDILEFRSPDPVHNAALNAALRGPGGGNASTSSFSGLLPPSPSAASNYAPCSTPGGRPTNNSFTNAATSSILSPFSQPTILSPPNGQDAHGPPWGWGGERHQSGLEMVLTELGELNADGHATHSRSYPEWVSLELSEFIAGQSCEAMGCSPDVGLWWEGAAGPNWHWQALQETARMEHRRLSPSPLDLISTTCSPSLHTSYNAFCDNLNHEITLLVQDARSRYEMDASKPRANRE